MRRLFLLLGLLASFAVSPPGRAQDAPAPKPGPSAQAEESKRSPLDDLFERLAQSKDELEARGIASLIERRWARSGSDTADLLMSRAAQALQVKDVPLAIELLDRVLVLQPDWAEAWYRRATAFFLNDDPVSAMADLSRALEEEPRHFGAWAGLGHIYMSSTDKRRAIEAYRRALAIHPQQEDLRTVVERLAPEIDGRDI